jgi:hypothetical protein
VEVGAGCGRGRGGEEGGQQCNEDDKGGGGPLALNGYNMKPSCCSLVNLLVA